MWFFGVPRRSRSRIRAFEGERRSPVKEHNSYGRRTTTFTLRWTRSAIHLRKQRLSFSPSATVTMVLPMHNLKKALGTVIRNLSNDNYQQSLARCRGLLEFRRTCSEMPSDLIFLAIWENIHAASRSSNTYIYPAAPLILRFASEAEFDPVFAPYTGVGLRTRLCARIMEDFLDEDLGALFNSLCPGGRFYMDVNLIAHCANLGYIEEAVIRDHILQHLSTPYPRLPGHRALALHILFKIAGATFEVYADPSVFSRCFELLRDHRVHTPRDEQPIQVSGPAVEGRRLEPNETLGGARAARAWLGRPSSSTSIHGWQIKTG